MTGDEHFIYRPIKNGERGFGWISLMVVPIGPINCRKISRRTKSLELESVKR